MILNLQPVNRTGNSTEKTLIKIFNDIISTTAAGDYSAACAIDICAHTVLSKFCSRWHEDFEISGAALNRL
jgi:hypothetical protein